MIDFNYKGTDYTLEFTRATAKAAEKAGLSLNEDSLDKMPITSIELLYVYAFKAHHSGISAEKAIEICKDIKDKDKFIIALVNEFSKPLVAMTEEPDEGNAIAWTTE